MHCRDGSSLTNAKKNKIKKEIVASTYVMISRNVHIYAWLKEAYVSAEVIDCVCTVSAT